MRNHAFGRRAAAICFLAMASLAVGSALGQTSTPAITTPSEQRGLNFNVPGVVSKVMVKEGDVVKKGDLIAQQDDSVDVADLFVKDLTAKAAVLQVTAAQKDLDEKKVELARDKQMFSKGVLGQSDLDKAELDVVIGEIRVTLADEERKQKDGDVVTERAKVNQKKMFATIDGIVQKINVHEGELATNDPKTPCIQIVQNGPLYVEVDLSVAAANPMKEKQILFVKYADEQTWRKAAIIFFNPVANAAAGTQRVRLELANPDPAIANDPVKRAGLQVEVSEVSKNLAEAK